MNNKTKIETIARNSDFENYEIEDIKKLIFTIRGKQVMLDSDVAKLYKYETKNVNKAMKRNIERFPEDFCFHLTLKELEEMWFQNGTTFEKLNLKYRSEKYLPYVYIEQGIAMLSGVLKNEIAIQISIKIIRAFIEMRRFLVSNGQIFERLTKIEYKLLEQDKKIENLFEKFDQSEKIKQKIFFEGQIWDSYELIINIIKTAQSKILIIDNYIDDSIFKMLQKKKNNVTAVVLTSHNSKINKLDVKKFNEQYPVVKLAVTNKFHDRFIIIDNKELYHCGASLKDLGKKCFAISKIEDNEILKRINENIFQYD